MFSALKSEKVRSSCNTNNNAIHSPTLVLKGDFTCCAKDHDFGTGVKVRCDKAKGSTSTFAITSHCELSVWPVLARMVNDAVRTG